MLNKGKKPEPKEESKDHPQVPAAPGRPETPRLLRAALEVTEKSSGLKGALAKVKEKTNKLSISSQVKNLKEPDLKQENADTSLHPFCSLAALRLLFSASSVSHLQLRTRQWCWHTVAHVCQLSIFSLCFWLPQPRHSGASFCFTVTDTKWLQFTNLRRFKLKQILPVTFEKN